MSTTKGTIILTGPNGGIGGGIAKEIVGSSYGITHDTIYVVRDPAKAEHLKAILKDAPKDHQHDILPLDFESLDAVRTFATEINKRVASGGLPPIQAVILNAGLQDVSAKHFTKDGMERVFEVNYLCNFLLGLLLLGSMDKKNGRIVYVGSSGTKLNYGPNQGNFTSPLAERDHNHNNGKNGQRNGGASRRRHLQDGNEALCEEQVAYDDVGVRPLLLRSQLYSSR